MRPENAQFRESLEIRKAVASKAVLSANMEKGSVKTMNSRSAKRIDTTLGELIAAASEVAFEYSENEREAYRLARLALIEMLKKASHPVDMDEEMFNTVTRKSYLH
jgi:hypothetical protein